MDDLINLVAVFRSRKRQQYLKALALESYVERPLIPSARFCIDRLTDADAILDFRFDVYGIRKLSVVLGLPTVIITASHDRAHNVEALAIVLNRLCFPRRFYDMMKTFGRSRESLCHIFLHTINLLYAKWKDLLFFNLTLVQRNMERFCNAIAEKGSPLGNVYGFIDGTKLQSCRISAKGDDLNLQKQVYSGHKRIHCLNYQAVSAPDGICIHFWGPIEGRRHDSTMLRRSKLFEYLAQHPELFLLKFIYGDPAYGITKFILSGYKGVNITQAMKEFNKLMSRVRQSVEWNFKIMKSLWAFITFKNLSKIRRSPVGKIVSIAMLLTNFALLSFWWESN